MREMGIQAVYPRPNTSKPAPGNPIYPYLLKGLEIDHPNQDGVKTTPCSQNSLNALAIDEPLEYARLALDAEMQAWVDAIDRLEVW